MVDLYVGTNITNKADIWVCILFCLMFVLESCILVRLCEILYGFIALYACIYVWVCKVTVSCLCDDNVML